MDTKYCQTVTIENTKGLHARASAKFVKCAEQYDADVTVSCKDHEVPGTSIMGLMMLAASPGTQIVISTAGKQAKEAMDDLTTLVREKFGED